MAKARWMTAMAGVIGLCTLAVWQPGHAEDMVLTGKIQDVVQAVDKNQKPYVRVIVTAEKTLQGISYEVGVPVMAFGSQVENARTLKKGDTLKAVCDKRETEGRTSYTLLKIVP